MDGGRREREREGGRERRKAKERERENVAIDMFIGTGKGFAKIDGFSACTVANQ